MTIKRVDNFLSAIDFPVGKCMIVGEPIKLATLENVENQNFIQKYWYG